MSSNCQVQQQLITQFRDTDVLLKPQRRRYYVGERVTAVFHPLDGRNPHTTCFTINYSPGSGFAGQVYCAQLADGSNPVAIKLLRPATHWKERFRDVLFRLSFQTAFAPRLREEAVRAGLIWQALLRVGTEIEWGTATAVAQPLGYFWDDELNSYAEVHEWINGRAARYAPDDQWLKHLLNRTTTGPDCEMRRQRHFMAHMTQLCTQMGAIGLARQYEWYTFVSQANVLRRREPTADQTEFVGVDFRPGLAVPFFLPLSPHHARLLWRGLRRGVLAHFDEVDLDKLDSYISQHPAEFASHTHLITQLKEDEAAYRAGLPDLWHHPTHLRRSMVQTAVATTWHKQHLISTEKPKHFYGYFLLDHLPIVGHWLMRWFGHDVYRRHWRRLMWERGYRQRATAVIRARDLLAWQEEGRVGTAVIATFNQSSCRYWLHKLGFSWLPPRWHRLLTDRHSLHRWLHDWFIYPLCLLFQAQQRQSWLHHIISQQGQNEVISPTEEVALHTQINQPQMQSFLRDLGLTAGLDLFAKTLYAVLAYDGLTSGNYLPFLIATLGPISPSGLVRASYVLLQLLGNLPQILRHRDSKLLLARLLGLAIAPWRALGNLFTPVEMFTYYPQMSALLADYLVTKMVNIVPVLGGRGKLLGYWAFQLTYNLPLSLRRWLLGA